MAGLPQGRGGSFSVVTCCPSPVSLVCSVSRCVPRPSRPPEGFRSLWPHRRPVGWGGGSLGEVSLGTFCREIASSVLKGLVISQKKATVVIQEMLPSCCGASVCPNSARLPLRIDGRAANLRVKAGLGQIHLLVFWGTAAPRYRGWGGTTP